MEIFPLSWRTSFCLGLLLVVCSCHAAGLARDSRATLVDDEDMAAEMRNDQPQFEILLSITILCPSGNGFSTDMKNAFVSAISHSLVSYINGRCTCNFTDSDIVNKEITCGESDYMYRYSAQIVDSEEESQFMPVDILNDINEWPKDHPKIAINTSLFGPHALNVSLVVEDADVSFSGEGSGSKIPGEEEEVEGSGVVLPTSPVVSEQEETTSDVLVVNDRNRSGAITGQSVLSLFVVTALSAIVMICL